MCLLTSMKFYLGIIIVSGGASCNKLRGRVVTVCFPCFPLSEKLVVCMVII